MAHVASSDLDSLQLTRADLRAVVTQVRWSPPRAFWRAKRSLEASLLAHSRSWETYAASHRLPMLRLLRNLIAEAEAEDVPAYRLAAIALARLAPDPWSEIESELLELLPPVSEDLRFLTCILEGRRPSAELVAQCFSDAPVHGLGWSLLHAETGKPQTALEAADRVRRYFSVVPEVDCATLAATLARCWRQDLPPLDTEALSTWTPRLRTAALMDFQSHKLLLAPSMVTELSCAAVGVPHSPEWWALRVNPALEALRALAAASRLHDREFPLPACGHAQLEYIGAMFMEVLDSGPKDRFAPLPRFANLLAILPQLEPSEIRDRLAYLSAMPGERATRFLTAAPDDREWLVTRTLHEALAEALLTDEEPDRVTDVLLELDRLGTSIPTLHAALRMMTGQHPRQRREHIVRAIQGRLDDETIAAWLAEASNDTIEWVTAALDPDRAAAIFLHQPTDGRRALCMIMAVSIQTLQQHTAPQQTQEFSQTVGLALAYGLDEGAGPGLHLLCAMLESQTDWHLRDLFPGGGLSESLFTSLCRSLTPSLLERMAEELRTALDPHGRRLWTRYLRRLRSQGEPVPEDLQVLATRHSTESAEGTNPPLLEAVHCYPEAYADPAIAELWPAKAPWPYAFIDAVFDSPTLAQKVLDRQTSLEIDADPLDLLPLVRERYASHPARAAAYELATAFSLRDARYLLWLARRAGRDSEGRAPGTAFDDLYHSYQLPKRSGGHRPITAPDPRLKRLQRRLLERGFDRVALHPAAHGFRPGHSIATNAQQHVGQEMVVNVDIEGFFPNTRYGLIVEACKQLAGGRLSKGAVMLAADICSYGGGLPTGAPTSPAIANIVLRPVDHAVASAAKRFGITYTRYADDLTFSGPGETHRIIPFVGRVLGDFGYRLDPKKTNIFRRGRRQVVTGLVVNEKVNVPRRVRRRLRAAVHQRLQGQVPHWHDKPLDDHRLGAYLAYLNVANPTEAARYRAQLDGADPIAPEGGS